MTLPGLALFYGGLVRSKNVLSVLMQVLAGFSIMALLWVVYGYSVAFGGDGSGAYFGGFDKLFLAGVTPDSTAATFSEGVVIPELTFVVFQLTFAAITPALIIGAIAERIKFGSVMLFLVLWFTFSYLPPRTWCGLAAAFSSRWVRSTSQAAPWSTSTPVSPALWPRSSSVRVSASSRRTWRRTT
jgi:ammonia channel protein AmtB